MIIRHCAQTKCLSADFGVLANLTMLTFIIVQVITNGRYKSVEHRAITNQERARLYVALFYNPGINAEVAPSSKIVEEDQ